MMFRIPSPRAALLLILALAPRAAAMGARAPSAPTRSANLTLVSGAAIELKGGERACFRLLGAQGDTERVRIQISFASNVPQGRIVLDGEEGFDFRDPSETFSFTVDASGTHQLVIDVAESSRVDRLSVSTDAAGIEAAACGTYDAEQTTRIHASPPPPQPPPVNDLERAGSGNGTRDPAAQPEEQGSASAPGLVVPAGTTLSITLQQELSTKTSHAGSTFSARLTDPLLLEGREVLAAGARVTGHVVESKDAGRFGRSTLQLAFDRISWGEAASAPLAATLTQVSKGSAKKQGGIIAGSAAGGALLGALLGGGDEALAGAALGAAIATGAIAAKPGESVTLPAGSVLEVTLDAPLGLPAYETAR